MVRQQIAAANILGAARAEKDASMLALAYVETADYKALTTTNDFNFVVGRRGTGKSALFKKVVAYYEGDRGIIAISDTPQEHHTLEIQQILHRLADNYKLSRAISRLTWRISILIAIASDLLDHYKINKSDEFQYLSRYRSDHLGLFKQSISHICVEILHSVAGTTQIDQSLPSRIASNFDVENLQGSVLTALEELNQRTVIIFDGLDEGWEPTASATAILGGLALTLSDAAEKSERFYGIAFIRDNMFRALANFDSDFSRHIEGNTLRLHWNSRSLLNLVANRLRIALNIDSVESDIKVWNRFAHRQLRDREGFDTCLSYTLYRPRDILVLLNRAYVIATREGRPEIVGEDIEETATSISQDRLDDLLKEYKVVFPGLKHFIKAFERHSPIGKVVDFINHLDEAITDATYELVDERDFALLGSGRQIFFALYAVGFVGLRHHTSGTYSFCYDGSLTKIDEIKDTQEVAVHPCYWKALGFDESTPSEEIAITISDEYGDQNPSAEPNEIRSKRFGQILEELPSLPMGSEGSTMFEKWVLRAAIILFSGKLSNFQARPNSDGIQRRDIVATNMAERGFWKRIREDYRSRQVIFEVKNYIELTEDDFRQALSYSSRDYGNFAIIVTRADENEGISEKEKSWIKEMYDQHQKLILTLPASLLKRCLSKLRNPNKKHDYTEDALGKRMDMFVRSYMSNRHQRRSYRQRK
jgi:hypothetical protein